MFCSAPFTRLGILDGHYSPCCLAWLDSAIQIHQPADRRFFYAADSGPWAVWNHSNMIRLRKAWLEGSAEYCQGCPVVANGELNDTRESHFTPKMDRGPTWIDLGQDRSCNLHCWSCRRQPIMEPYDPEKEWLLDIFMAAFLPGLQTLSLSHSGDPLASPLYRGFLKDLSPDECPATIRLFTNGLLVPKYWSQLGPITKRIRWISVSVDAATKGTYEQLRRGARWQDLLEALAFISDLRLSGQVDRFVMNFCIQTVNFREIPAFVGLALKNNATGVHFGMIRRWWQSKQEYAAHSLADSNHPLAEEFKAILQDPLLKHPIVGPGAFRAAWRHVVNENELKKE